MLPVSVSTTYVEHNKWSEKQCEYATSCVKDAYQQCAALFCRLELQCLHQCPGAPLATILPVYHHRVDVPPEGPSLAVGHLKHGQATKISAFGLLRRCRLGQQQDDDSGSMGGLC